MFRELICISMGGGGGGGGLNSHLNRKPVDGVSRVGFISQSISFDTKRSDCNVNREPYPGSYAQIRQDFRPKKVSITEYWDAPWVGASSDLRADWGLTALCVAQEGDTLLGSTVFLRMFLCPDDGLRPCLGFFIGIDECRKRSPVAPYGRR